VQKPQLVSKRNQVGGHTPDSYLLDSVVFEAKAAAASVLGHSRSSGPGNGKASSANRARQLREYFGLTQTELAHALGVSLRTVQNWERAGVAGSPRQLRDLERAYPSIRWSIFSVKGCQRRAWLRVIRP
jgi:DNA-binding transcriptional regulator YiaG